MAKATQPLAPIFDLPNEEEEERALSEAEGQIADGKFIQHAAMVKWLLSWGSSDELPPPESGD
jgi:predicted transcriptional regulator